MRYRGTQRAMRRLRREFADLRPPRATVLRWTHVDSTGAVRFGAPGRGVEDQPSDRVSVGEGATWGDHVTILLGPVGRIEIGAGAALGSHVVIAADDHVSIGPGASVGGYSVLADTWTYGGTTPWPHPPPPAEPVILGARCVLGVRVVIGPGIEIAAETRVEPGALVHRALELP